MNDTQTGLPLALTKFLRDTLSVTTFIETGTGLGRTAKIAASMFAQVYTIEASVARWQFNVQQFKNSNVICECGESPYALQEIVVNVTKPSIIFLDAHCSYRPQVTDVPCPILGEIAVIPSQHIVIIDDAHSFTYPHKIAKLAYNWPELSEIILALHKRDNPYIFIEGKSIVSVPREYKKRVQELVAQK